VHINMEYMAHVQKCFLQSSLVQMTRQMIHNQLLNNGIVFRQGAEGVGIEDDDLIEDRWVPFCADVIDSVMCHGVVVVHIGKCFPTVLRTGTYILKMVEKNHAYEILAYEKGKVQKLLSNVVVFDHFGFSPTLDGLTTSIMTKILPRLQFLKTLRETTVRMEAQRSQPHYFAELKDSGNSQSTREGIDFDFYADANAGETREHMSFQRNAAAVAMLDKQRSLYESYLSAEHAAKSSAQLENVTQLPMGQSIHNPVQGTGRGDLVHVHRLFQEEVCSAFGVPRSMMFSDGSGSRSTDTVGTHQSFMHTLLWWKKKLSVVLSEVYNAINATKIAEKIDFKKDQCVDELKRKYQVRVYFPVTPFVSNSELRDLYEQGVISWKSYGEYALRNISLPIEDLQPQAPPKDELMFEKPEVPEAKPDGKPEGESVDNETKSEDKEIKKDDAKPDDKDDKDDKTAKKDDKDDKKAKKDDEEDKKAKKDDDKRPKKDEAKKDDKDDKDAKPESKKRKKKEDKKDKKKQKR